MIALFLDDLPARATLSSRVDQGGLLAHDAREARRVVAKTGRVARQKTVCVSEERLKSIRILPAILPGKNPAMRHDGIWMFHIHEKVAQVNAVAHPLVGDAAGKFFVKTKLEMKLRIERPERLGHQPDAPVRVLFTNHLDFGAPAPARAVIIPLNLVLSDFAENAGADQVACSKLIRFAAVLRADLSDKIPGHNGIARRLDLFE